MGGEALSGEAGRLVLGKPLELEELPLSEELIESRLAGQRADPASSSSAVG